jgi:hypothetical protein
VKFVMGPRCCRSSAPRTAAGEAQIADKLTVETKARAELKVLVELKAGRAAAEV